MLENFFFIIHKIINDSYGFIEDNVAISIT